ncbi:hypothetical protein HDU86_006220 [Geranomyces michiganensis]|nr:hypothetical protein HDU86_006220 [Geranomyces michiganensis]
MSEEEDDPNRQPSDDAHHPNDDSTAHDRSLVHSEHEHFLILSLSENTLPDASCEEFDTDGRWRLAAAHEIQQSRQEQQQQYTQNLEAFSTAPPLQQPPGEWDGSLPVIDPLAEVQALMANEMHKD